MESLLELEDVVCLELPLNVINLEKAIDAVGGREEIARSSSEAAFSKDASSLQLRLREDRFHHPVNSAALPTSNIVIEIQLPQEVYGGDENDVKAALEVAASKHYETKITPRFHTKLTHRFREIADFQYYTADSNFVNRMNQSIFSGNLGEIQKLSLHNMAQTEDILPPPRFTVSTQPFYYGYKQSPYVKVVDDESGERRLVQTSSTAKVISNVLNWGDPVPSEPPSGLDTNPRANIKECIDTLTSLFSKRASYTRRSLQHKLGGSMSRYLKYALPYVSYYYRSGPWRGAYIKYGCDPSKQPELAKYQVEHFRISTEEQPAKSGAGKDEGLKVEEKRLPSDDDYTFDGTAFPDVPLLQLSDIADGFLEKYIQTGELRSEVDINDGWYPDRTMSIIRKVLRAELVSLKDTLSALPIADRKAIAESLLSDP